MENRALPVNLGMSVFDNEELCHCGKKGCLKPKHRVRQFIVFL